MERILYPIKIKKSKLKEYESIHLNASKELLETIKECGFVKEYIFIFNNYSIVFWKPRILEKVLVNF